MDTWKFWRQTLERAVKTAAQAVLIGLSIGEGFNAFNFDPMLGLGFAAGGAIFSILTSVASLPLGAHDSPSAID